MDEIIEKEAEKEAEKPVESQEEIHDDMLPAELDLVPLERDTKETLKEIVGAQSIDELKDYAARFSLNMAKKNAVRVAKLQNLLDSVNELAISRFEKSPGEFSNKEVLDYMKAVQEQIDSSQQAIDTIGDTPMIQINNQKNEVNINVEHPGLQTRESKERVINAVKALMQNLTAPANEEESEESDEKNGVVIEEKLYNSEEENADGEEDIERE